MAAAAGLRQDAAAKVRSEARVRAMRPAAEPNVIPFIDILLVLLIIFMVTAPQPTVDIKVDLPRGVSAPMSGLQPTVVGLRQTPAGLEVSVDGDIVPFAQLADAAFSHARANNPALGVRDVFSDARLYVRADQSTPYANVVKVIDTLQGAGFAKVGIFAELAEGGE